ncbi:MAG: hypothetical protein HOW73_24745 [Polyangiaceae bacterium]|nr:hypothetical protein [Polyangiaceae bacterium]
MDALRFLSFVTLLSLTAVACSRRGGQTREPKTARDVTASHASPLTAEETQHILEQVSGARAMVIKRDVRVERLSPEAFRAEVTRRAAGSSEGTDSSLEEALLVGFDFLPVPSKRKDVASGEELLVEQVAAFYDRKEDKVYIPIVTPESEKEALVQRAIVAHEMQHALQEQAFGLQSDGDVSTDEALARLALVEGDAMVAMGAYIGAELGAPVGRTLRRIRETTEQVPREALAHEQHGSALSRSIDLARERLSFPYEAGMFFVSDLYRAGGFPLVDSVFAKPPTTTEQILHPEKYLAGEGARPIRPLDPIAGMRQLGSDSLGELQTRVLLTRCTSEKIAREAAAGWAGDRFYALTSNEGDLAMSWVTTWDSEDDARAFETAITSPGCFGENSIVGRTITASVTVKRRGDVVAFVRGLDETRAKQLVSKLLELPGPAPKATPVSTATIPPRVALPEPKHGTLKGDVYRNEWLGIVGRVPEGMRARVGDDDLDLLIDRPDTLIAGALSISTRITSDEENDRTFREVRDAFGAALFKHGLELRALGGGPAKTPLGSGIERTWAVSGTPARFRAVLVPICAGTGAILIVEGYGDPFAKSVLDGWTASFRFAKGRNVPACDYLDPK